MKDNSENIINSMIYREIINRSRLNYHLTADEQSLTHTNHKFYFVETKFLGALFFKPVKVT